MIERWIKIRDRRGASGEMLNDISKAFDCLTLDLLIAKLEAYGLRYKSLSLIHSYLSGRKQRIRIITLTRLIFAEINFRGINFRVDLFSRVDNYGNFRVV